MKMAVYGQEKKKHILGTISRRKFGDLPCKTESRLTLLYGGKCTRTRNKRAKKYENTYNRISGILLHAVLRTYMCNSTLDCARGGGMLVDQRSILTLLYTNLRKYPLKKCTDFLRFLDCLLFFYIFFI